jgi:hypothetical protein
VTGRRGAGLLLAVLTAATSLSACGVKGLDFVQNTGVSIIAPRNRATVRLPLTIEWKAKAPSSAPTSYAVFVDRAPQPSGRALAWVFRGDPRCRAQSSCPDEARLADAQIFVTSATSLTLDRIDRISSFHGDREPHEVTVVVLDGHGRRVGEGAFRVEFRLERTP